MLSDIGLQSADTVVTDYEPQLQRTESSAERNAPVTVVYGRLGVTVLQIEWVNYQGLGQLVSRETQTLNVK